MKWHLQLSRYAVVGLASNAFCYLLYLTFTYVGMGHKTAMTLFYSIGVIQSFYFNRGWSFSHTGNTSSSFVRYVAAYVLGYLLNLGILALGVDLLNYPHQLIQAAAIVIVAMALFILHKFWVFAPDGQGREA